MLRRLRRILLIVLASLVLLLLIAALTATGLLRGSLPVLDGTRSIAGLSAPVTVERDSLGVPTIRGADRADVTRALGYLHGQERFFQMDLLRRSAAGELAALLGPAVLGADRDTRRHRFRSRARAVVAAAAAEEHLLLDAYAAGVNAGLDDLRSRPFEYLALKQQPEPWRPEDTVLAICAMFLDLSLSTADTESAWDLVDDTLPPSLASYLLPRGNRWEAPVQGGPLPLAALPDSADVNVRTWLTDTLVVLPEGDPVFIPIAAGAGSNNWAVAGHRTAHGGALLADDMHLGFQVPNIWYRARLEWGDSDDARMLVGVTLPGTPALIVGSNGHAAWGFTNSYGDWADLVILETDPDDPTRHLTPDGWEPIRLTPERIEVADAPAETLWVKETRWGPIWTEDAQGRRLALRWTAHDVEGVNVSMLALDDARSVDDVVAVAGTMGIPQQNIVCADADGSIAWAIAGRIPRRVGWDGRLPVSWADGSCRWDGYYTPDEQPRIVDPDDGLLWSANSRVVAGDALRIIGDGGYGLGARARQIRNGLHRLQTPDEGDMLALQLDDRAEFMNEWRTLALSVLSRCDLDDDAVRGPGREEFRRLLTEGWSGHASIESAGYRLVRTFVGHLLGLVYDGLTGPCRLVVPDFHPSWLPYRHAVVMELMTEQPLHLLPLPHESWDALALTAVDRAMDSATSDGEPAAAYTWGRRNTVSVRHPFTYFAPWLERWLASPPRQLPGDSFMPRVQHPGSGASQRMVVSPGREEHGILHMPGGQSGHPLSPFFLSGHEDWESGRATALLPGPARHVLTLEPGR